MLVKCPKRAGDKNMEDMKWESIVLDVNEYLEAATDLEDGLAQVLRLNLQIGTNNPSEREASHMALKALLRGRDGTPFGKGKRSSVPTAVRVAIDRICGVVETAAIGYYNHDAIIGAVTFARGGATYDSAEDYAKAVVKSTRAKLAKAFKAQTWDGTVDSLLSESEE
jgi:hypothetical protein